MKTLFFVLTILNSLFFASNLVYSFISGTFIGALCFGLLFAISVGLLVLAYYEMKDYDRDYD